MTRESIRKAAILISALDPASADALLGQMGEEQAERVRNAVMDLEEIPADEQQCVIAEFLGAPAGDGNEPEMGVELDESLTHRLEAGDNRYEVDTRAKDRHAGRSPPPFHFLHHADPSILADYLQREHPQTAAVVISHLPPEQAAELLERMPAALSTEALRRMAWLDSTSPEVLADVEREMKAVLLPKLRSPETRLHGLATVQAVLSALDGSRRSELLARLAGEDQRLLRQLGYGAPAAESGYSTPRAEVASFRYRLEPAPLPSAAPAVRQERGNNELALDFEELADLDQASLRRLVAAADLQLFALALTGTEDRLTQRMLSQLPARDARLVRERLEHPGPMRLRDIEQAQQSIASLAGRLASRGEISLPRDRTFAAAV